MELQKGRKINNSKLNQQMQNQKLQIENNTPFAIDNRNDVKWRKVEFQNIIPNEIVAKTT